MLGSAILSAAAQAAPGDLDPTFSGDGKQTTGFARGPSVAKGGGDPADGKIVVVGSLRGHVSTSASPSPATTRTAPSTRASPATAGRRPTSGRLCPANGVAIQADGKIVVVGSRRRRQRFALARYNPNGTLDTSFSGDGKQTTDFAGTTRRPGWRSRATARSSWSARHGASTAPTSPSPATTPTARSTRASPATASRRPTSAATTRRTGWRSRATARSSRSGRGGDGDDFALARYNPNGSLDTSFSGDGKQTTDFGGPTTRRTRWRSRRTARSSRSAHERQRTGSHFALARYNPNGSLDPSFSGDGKQTTDFGGTSTGLPA